MDYIDIFHPTEANDYSNEQELQDFKLLDRGYNKIYRKTTRIDGRTKKNKIDIYASGSQGSHIRDAETGHTYPYLVGSKHENLFFKTSMSTGECKSKNGSNTLFYLSPSHFASHMNVNVSDSVIKAWDEKKEICQKELESKKKPRTMYI